jgi:hypothetical protein
MNTHTELRCLIAGMGGISRGMHGVLKTKPWYRWQRGSCDRNISNRKGIRMRTLRFAAYLVALTLMTGNLALAAEPGLLTQDFGGINLDGRPSGLCITLDIGPRGVGSNNQMDGGLRYIGLLTPPADGEYIFRVEADTGVRVKINGTSVIDGWSPGGARTGKATLAKATPVPIVVEYYFNRAGGGKKAELRLFWTPPGGREVPVPRTAYTHEPQPSLIEVRGDEQLRLNLQLPDGGLKPVVGVQNIQVMRTNRNKPELADGDGWTYAHHQDLAAWKGRLYAAWAMTPRDEDVPPYKVVYATSKDGLHWSAPADLFPRENAWANRFYFYRASNGRMLAFCPGKNPDGKAANWKVLLVREITADHQLGKVFTLVTPLPDQPPFFDTAADPAFVAACREAAGNNLLLEQQDLGGTLGDRRMKWHQNAPQSGGWPFGKALCFYHRQDGAVVGVCKMGFVTLSEDGGKTWAEPEISPTLIAGGGKVWGQRTADGRYAMAYNPIRSITERWPLVLIHGNNGREFKDMRVIYGEMPPRRYPGGYKNNGAQYMRGLAEWADDGTLADRQAMWLVYSVNKEDIWVSRIPLPVKPDETAFPTDDFTKATPGAVVLGWNVYSPKWAPVAVVENGGQRSMELRDGDPFDYARAVRAFPEAAKVRAELELTPAQASAWLEIELCDPASRRPVRVVLTETGMVQAADGNNAVDLGKYTAGERLSLVIAADAAAGRYRVQVNGGAVRELAVAEADTKTLQQLSLRTGVWRGVTDNKGVDAAADVPLPTPAVFQVQRVNIGAP